MGDFVATKKLEVEVQENGIIRTLEGEIIARLVDGVDFEELVEELDSDCREAVCWCHEKGAKAPEFFCTHCGCRGHSYN